MPIVILPKAAVTKFDLPPVCVVTGESEGVVYKKVRFSFVPMWARLSILFCGLVGIVLMLVTTKRVTGELPFLESAFAEWRRAQRVTGIGLLVALLVGVGLMVGTDALLLGFAVLIAGVIAVVAYAAAVVRKLGPACRRIDDQHIEIEIPSEAAARAIEARLGIGGQGTPGKLEAGNSEDRYDRMLDAELERMDA